MEKKIAIIGAGIAGLSAGCYARMNGYKAEIFEMHTTAGGVCTGWKRKGYTFDGCLHWLTGSSGDNPFHAVWEELGALRGKKVMDHEIFSSFVTSAGRRINQYADIRRYVDELSAVGPEDAAALDRLRDDIKLFQTLPSHDGPPPKTGPLTKLRMMWKIRRYLPLFKRFGGSNEDFISRFKSADVRDSLSSIVFIPNVPATSLLGLLSWLDKKEAGWPEGGSLALAKSIEKRFIDLGGVVHYGAKVDEILVKDDRAVGVRLVDGSMHAADEVIGAADGRSTIFGMLKGRYVGPELQNVYDTFPLYTPLLQVSFGVARDMSAEPRLTMYKFDPPASFGDTRAPWAGINNYSFDSTLSPKGKTALTVLFWSPFDIWEKLAGDRARYADEKARVERDVLGWLEKVYPGIQKDVEVTDIATPLTTVRYTGNYRASYEGWRPSMATWGKQIPGTLPGLSGFRMIGQWTAPFAGLPTVATDGKRVIRSLCEQDGKEFTSSTP
jgi:phytoene dehydrogenase-like protein